MNRNRIILSFVLNLFICSTSQSMERAHKRQKIDNDSTHAVNVCANPFDSLPTELIKTIVLFSSPTEESFEDLQHLLNIMAIDKCFNAIAKEIYNKRVANQNVMDAAAYNFNDDRIHAENGLIYKLRENLLRMHKEKQRDGNQYIHVVVERNDNNVVKLLNSIPAKNILAWYKYKNKLWNPMALWTFDNFSTRS